MAWVDGLFEEHLAIAKFVIMWDTWGHLAPKRGKVYRATILYAQTEWGQSELISMDFEGLSSSPWLFEQMKDYIFDLSKKQDTGVYRFIGIYRKFKNGKYRFTGKNVRIKA